MIAELILVEKMKLSVPPEALKERFQRATAGGLLEEVNGEFRSTFAGRQLLLSAKWLLDLCRVHREKGVPTSFLSAHHQPALAALIEEGAILRTPNSDRFYGAGFLVGFNLSQVVENF